MALPTSEADIKRLVDMDISYAHTRVDWTSSFNEMTKLPKLQPLWKRAWCGLRGHGGLTPMPGDVFYQNDRLCKRCGSRVTLF
jgi:hypothetical protein